MAQLYKRVGSYDLYNCIGQGSFASVYRGEHRPTRRIVAVKAIVRARLNRKLQVRGAARTEPRGPGVASPVHP